MHVQGRRSVVLFLHHSDPVTQLFESLRLEKIQLRYLAQRIETCSYAGMHIGCNLSAVSGSVGTCNNFSEKFTVILKNK